MYVEFIDLGPHDYSSVCDLECGFYCSRFRIQGLLRARDPQDMEKTGPSRPSFLAAGFHTVICIVSQTSRAGGLGPGHVRRG